MPELDHKVVEEVYQSILLDFKRAASTQGRGVEDAEEVTVEAITRMLEAHQEKPIDNPLHWARRAAARLWKDIGRDDRRHVSFEGVVGVSHDTGPRMNADTDGVREERARSSKTRDFEKGKLALPGNMREQMSEAVMEPRSPELITEQRDLLQKIDPDWRLHMEEGFDFSSGKKLDRNTRRQIQRRARALLRNEPLPPEFDTTIGARVREEPLC